MSITIPWELTDSYVWMLTRKKACYCAVLRMQSKTKYLIILMKFSIDFQVYSLPRFLRWKQLISFGVTEQTLDRRMPNQKGVLLVSVN